MPAVTSGKVLVTGANGYIAVWLVQRLLEQGYSVRGTARSESKGKHLKETFEKYGDKFEFVVVEDITKEGAFDEAVKNVDAIEHTASPFHLQVIDPQELIGPAVAGTSSIFQSALKHGSSVKRVIVTSSAAAILEIIPNPPIFNETNWNSRSLREVETKGKEAAVIDMYRTSKILAEKAAWAFVESNKGQIGFDLVVINPPMVMGPVLQEVDKPDNLNTSMLDWYRTVVKGVRSNEELFTISSSFVDVRDVAEGHVLALQKEEAAGNRILISSEPYIWQEWVNIAHAIDSSLPAGDTSADLSKAIYPLRYDNSKSKTLLGMKYRGKEETTRDILAQFKEKGWY